MKAIIVHEYGEPEVMKLEDVPTPEPANGQVLVRIEAAGVNPVDTYMRSGNHAHAPKLPYTPGKDAAGVVERIGENVTKFDPGDRVYTAGSISGTYAEYSLCDEKHLGRLPDSVGFEAGAGIWTPYATAYRALFQRARATSGETVFVHGASGGVGIAAVQWAKNAGLTVIGSASSADGKTLVSDQGADHVVDHTDEGHLEEVLDITGGRGVDVIIEMLANVNLQKDFEVLAMFGRITVVGNRGSLEFNPRAIMGKDATIYGMSLFNAPAKELEDIKTSIFDGLSQGYLNPIVGESIPLSDAPRAHHQVIESKAFGKIVLVP
jgi:NADPH2:quinone reductase